MTFIARRQVFVMWSSVEVALPIQLALCKFAVYFLILCKYSFAFHGVDRHTAWLRSSFTTVWLFILYASTAMYRSVSSLWKRDNEQCLSQKLFLMGTFYYSLKTVSNKRLCSSYSNVNVDPTESEEWKWGFLLTTLYLSVCVSDFRLFMLVKNVCRA